VTSDVTVTNLNHNNVPQITLISKKIMPFGKKKLADDETGEQPPSLKRRKQVIGQTEDLPGV
jgi:hypothetical protein